MKNLYYEQEYFCKAFFFFITNFISFSLSYFCFTKKKKKISPLLPKFFSDCRLVDMCKIFVNN